MSLRPFVECLFMRHGETDWNRHALVQGHEDQSRLTPEGRAHVARVARSLIDEGVTLIVASDLHRAQESAEIVAHQLGRPVVTCPLLRERSFGVLEGGPRSALVTEMTGIAHDVVVDVDCAPDGGETLRALTARAEAFFALAASEWRTEHLLVVTHGGTIRALLSVANNRPLLGSRWGDVDNCSLWRANGPRDAAETPTS
ncbi:MAG: histidine phosphatase family protein [Acidobacteriota bacterium]|nr:histidine phosphatase family protein [Acidobacteriota bacterium]MDE3107172.1 histidine phosphatase family protein [Acidobacteriota bacterium]